MRYRSLGNSGLLVSVAGLGCNNFGSRLDVQQTRAVVDAAIDAGITLFDTADIYGNAGGSEEMLGEVLGARRDQIVLATKFGHERVDMGYGPAARRAEPLVAARAGRPRPRSCPRPCASASGCCRTTRSRTACSPGRSGAGRPRRPGSRLASRESYITDAETRPGGGARALGRRARGQPARRGHRRPGGPAGLRVGDRRGDLTGSGQGERRGRGVDPAAGRAGRARPDRAPAPIRAVLRPPVSSC